ncbi:hypothetical protein [Roseiconus lacunae]|uniref:hypothetical protein n=1 Tax=Roseiconus lacunae TaxID=2605694 RepID=UPI001F45A20D|nr:hypothetical protein [Roseiconus lacunae]
MSHLASPQFAARFRSRRFVTSVISLMAFSVAWIVTEATAEDGTSTLRVGAATSNITPPLGEKIVGGWTPVPATLIHDELHARCIVIDDGKTQVAIVACDNVGIPREVFDHAKNLAEQATGLPASHQLLASTHTHSATTARGETKTQPSEELTAYQQFVARRIADAISQAMTRRQPARIGYGFVDEPSEVFNRRWFVTDSRLGTNPFGGTDQVRMNPPRGNAALDRQAGPVDPQISFLCAVDLQDRPIALLANYSLHYVGGVPSGEVSADYFGYFAKAIEQRLGADEETFVAMLTNGTSGDVNNIDFRNSQPKRYQPYEKMREVAGKVADRVHESYDAVEFKDSIEVAVAASDLTLDVRQPSEAMLAHFAKFNADPDAETTHRREAIYAKRVAAIAAGPKTVTVPLQAIRLGDLGIAAIPFETFAETGLEIKERAPTKHAFTIELAGGSYGYLPTPRQHRFGGYETWLGTNNVQKDASVLIVDELMRLFESIQPTSDRPTDGS